MQIFIKDLFTQGDPCEIKSAKEQKQIHKLFT